MNEYFKSILLDVKVDKSSLDDAFASLQRLKKYELINEDTAKKINSQYEEYVKRQSIIAQLQKEIALLSKLNTKEANEAVKALQAKMTILQGFTKNQPEESDLSNFTLELEGISVAFLRGIKNVFSSAISEMNEMLSYSKLSSSRTRDLAFSYGLSSSQAYGFDTALSMLGLSEEDLMYMNPQEQKQFQEAMTKYSNKYTELLESGYFEKMQEYQFEMQDFKLEVQQELIGFFIDNKDTIMTAMKWTISASEFIIGGLSSIIDFLGIDSSRTSSDRIASTQDIIGSYSTSKSTNISIDNTFNNVSKSDQTWLANAGQMTYEQIIRAIGGE